MDFNQNQKPVSVKGCLLFRQFFLSNIVLESLAHFVSNGLDTCGETEPQDRCTIPWERNREVDKEGVKSNREVALLLKMLPFSFRPDPLLPLRSPSSPSALFFTSSSSSSSGRPSPSPTSSCCSLQLLTPVWSAGLSRRYPGCSGFDLILQ